MRVILSPPPTNSCCLVFWRVAIAPPSQRRQRTIVDPAWPASTASSRMLACHFHLCALCCAALHRTVLQVACPCPCPCPWLLAGMHAMPASASGGAAPLRRCAPLLPLRPAPGGTVCSLDTVLNCPAPRRAAPPPHPGSDRRVVGAPAFADHVRGDCVQEAGSPERRRGMQSGDRTAAAPSLECRCARVVLQMRHDESEEATNE